MNEQKSIRIKSSLSGMGEILSVISKNLSARQPIRPFNGLQEKPNYLAYLRSLTKANSENIARGAYSDIVTHFSLE